MSTNSDENREARSEKQEGWLRRFTRDLRRMIINGGSEIGAWLAPLPSAVSVANAAHRHLGYEPWLAVVVGAVVELLGFATTNRAFDLWYYNQTRREDEPKAPLFVAGTLVVIYVVSTIALSVISDLATDVVHYLPAIFPIMALTGTINVALGRQHDMRLENNARVIGEQKSAAEKAEAERKQAEAEAKAEQLRREQEAKADVERLRLERKADREARRDQGAMRQVTRRGSTDDATGVAIDRDTFVRLFTTQDYDDVADVAHSLGFNGELKEFYDGGRRSVSRLASLVGVHPRSAQRWVDAANVASGAATGTLTPVLSPNGREEKEVTE